MLGWLSATAFTAFGAPPTRAELSGFVTVWLVVRQHIANWPRVRQLVAA